MTSASKRRHLDKATQLFCDAWYDVMPKFLVLLALEHPAAYPVLTAIADEAQFTPDVTVSRGLSNSNRFYVSWMLPQIKAIAFLDMQKDIKTALQLEVDPSFGYYRAEMQFSAKTIETLFAGTKYKDKLLAVLQTFDEDEDAY